MDSSEIICWQGKVCHIGDGGESTAVVATSWADDSIVIDFILYMLRKRTLFKETVALLFARLFVMLLCDIATMSRHLKRDNFQRYHSVHHTAWVPFS